MPQPAIFIGSSTEGLAVARAIQEQLQHEAQVTLWNEGVFWVSETYIESLTKAIDTFDFAILVFRADDTLTSRDRTSPATRGNVLFELGLFMGRIGRSRTFVVYDRHSKPEIVSDLAGISFAPYDGSPSDNLLTAVGPACNEIRRAIARCNAQNQKPRDVRSKLRQLGDWVWNLSEGKLIRDWKFDLHLHGPLKGTKLLSDGFSLYEVRKCEYITILPDKPFTFGMIFGQIDVNTAWQANPVYLHQIYIDGFKDSEKKFYYRVIQEKLSNPDTAWDAFFQNVQLKIWEIETNKSYDLTPAEFESGDSFVIRSFGLPGDARRLIGKEVKLDIRFKSITPTSLCNFTLEFPWLTSTADAQVTVHGETEYLVFSSHFFGDRKLDIKTQTYGNSRKIRISTDDLVLPVSSIPIRWCFVEGGTK